MYVMIKILFFEKDSTRAVSHFEIKNIAIALILA